MSDQEARHTFDRLRRALTMARSGAVERVGPMQFRVQSQSKKNVQYDVDLSGDPPCYCEDQEWAGVKTGKNCKHVLAAKILMQHPSVVEPLTELVYQQHQRNEELTRKRRRSA